MATKLLYQPKPDPEIYILVHCAYFLIFGQAARPLPFVPAGDHGTISAARFIAPSLPFKGDQAVDAHAARAPALLRGEGLVYRTMCFEGL